jgi:hypothetical protein
VVNCDEIAVAGIWWRQTPHGGNGKIDREAILRFATATVQGDRSAAP